MNSFKAIDFGGGLVDQSIETVSPGIVGSTVDYLTRLMTGSTPPEAFSISFQGMRKLGEYGIDESYTYETLLERIDGLSDVSITSACQLAGFDSAYRAGVTVYRPVLEISPDFGTIKNIRKMVERSIAFFEKFGPVVISGPTFEGGYTDTVAWGDGDFLTQDTLWDFKVSKQKVSPKQTLQLLMYYLLWRRSIHANSIKIEHLGIFNPRTNIVCLKNIADIPTKIIDEVDLGIIGYKKPYQRDSAD